MMKSPSLHDNIRTLVLTGASRGIGHGILLHELILGTEEPDAGDRFVEDDDSERTQMAFGLAAGGMLPLSSRLLFVVGPLTTTETDATPAGSTSAPASSVTRSVTATFSPGSIVLSPLFVPASATDVTATLVPVLNAGSFSGCRCATAGARAPATTPWHKRHDESFVCAGIVEYLNADVTLVRLGWVMLSIVPGGFAGGIVAYLAAWFIMPNSPVSPVVSHRQWPDSARRSRRARSPPRDHRAP